MASSVRPGPLTPKPLQVFISSPDHTLMQFETWSYRFADQVLNSKLALKNELESVIHGVQLPTRTYLRPELNRRFEKLFLDRGWQRQPRVFEDEDVEAEQTVPFTRIDFLKERVGIEVAFSHESFIGLDVLKFQTLSYANLDKIDLGVYICATHALHKATGKAFKGSILFEKVQRYLPHFKSAIQVPIWLVGLLPS